MPTTLFTSATAVSFFTLSPDGSRVFTMNDALVVVSIPAAGGTPVEIGTFNLAPIGFSPDGKKLAFVTDKPEGPSGMYALGIGPLDGPFDTFGGSFEIGGSGGSQPVFLPDGSRAIVDWTGNQQPMLRRHIDSINVADGAATSLMTADKGQYVGLVGANRNTVLFASQLGAVSPELSVVDAAGGTPVKLSTLDKCVLASMPRDYYAISPDGTQAAYIDAVGDLVLADLDARKSSTLVSKAKSSSTLCSGFLPRWAPSGDKPVYESCPAAGNCGLRVITPAGDQLATSDTYGGDADVFFSPDGDRLIIGKTVFTFGPDGTSSATFNAGIPPLSIVDGPKRRSGFVPITFPWIDDRKFVVETGTNLAPNTGIVELGN